MASVVGPVGLLMVLLVGGCVAEGKCGARGCPGAFPCVCVCERCVSPKPGLLVWLRSLCALRRLRSKMPPVCWVLRELEVNDACGTDKTVGAVTMAVFPWR